MISRSRSETCDEVGGCKLPGKSALTLSASQISNDDAFLVASVSEALDPALAAAEAYGQIADALHRRGMDLFQERIFGSLGVEAAVGTARREALESRGICADGSFTYVQGRPTWGDGLAGVIVHAVPSESVSPIVDGGMACGRLRRTDDTLCVILQNMKGASQTPGGDNTRAAQARQAIERADRILRASGARYDDVVRTWFYLADILEWYGEFNEVRNAKYAEFDLLPGPGRRRLPPASTGIRAELPGGGACSLDLLAVVAPASRGSITACLSNPRQQDAFCYGSAFSRSAVVHGAQETLIEVSGTAAIDEDGKSLHMGDIRAQVRCTLDKVAALLEQTHASVKDISAATVFVKDGGDAQAAREVLAELGLEGLPAVWVVADVCRDELLFEIDAEAIVPRQRE